MKFPEIGYGRPLNKKWIRKMVLVALGIFFAIHYVYLIVLNNTLTELFYSRAVLIGKRSQLTAKYPIVWNGTSLQAISKAEEILVLLMGSERHCGPTEKTVAPYLQTWVYACDGGSYLVSTLFVTSGEFVVNEFASSGSVVAKHVYFLRNDSHIAVTLYENGKENSSLAESASNGAVYSQQRSLSFSYKVREIDDAYVCRHEGGSKHFVDYKEGEFDVEGVRASVVRSGDGPAVFTVLCEHGGALFGETVLVYSQ